MGFFLAMRVAASLVYFAPSGLRIESPERASYANIVHRPMKWQGHETPKPGKGDIKIWVWCLFIVIMYYALSGLLLFFDGRCPSLADAAPSGLRNSPLNAFCKTDFLSSSKSFIFC
jgi:hypothetical protein